MTKNNNILNSFFIALVVFCVLGLLIGGTQIYFWDMWDESITTGIDAEYDKCNNILNMNADNEQDFINYERTNADSNTFSISERCFFVLNDKEFALEKKFKTSYYFRIFWWLVVLAITSLVFGISKQNYDNVPLYYQTI